MFCFIKSMTVSVQNNYSPINNMKVQRPNVGVINAPNSLKKPVLYSHIQATREFNKLDAEVNQKIKKAKPKTKDTPKAVYVFLGLGALLLSIPFLKKLIKK